jgi:glucosyl-dolichyl phosphate glucuronosyltransferase
MEIIVVDNASSDDTESVALMAQKEEARLRYVYEPVLGLSNARNRGVIEAGGDIVAFMDDDAQAEPGWALAIVEAFEHEPRRPLCVGGKVRPIWEKPRPKWLPDAALSSLTILDYGDESRELEFPREWLAGCNLAFSRDFLLQTSFNTSLGRRGLNLNSNEELAVLSELARSGGLIRYEAKAVVRHLVPASRLRMTWLLRRAFAQGVSDVLWDSLKSERGPGKSRIARPGLRAVLWHFKSLLGSHTVSEIFRQWLALAYYLGVAVEKGKQRLARTNRDAAALEPRR